MYRLKLFFVLTAFAILVVACSQSASTPNKSNSASNAANTPPLAPSATTVDEVAMTTDLYTKNCMICHKDSGKGGKVTIDGKSLKPNDLTADKIKNRSDDKLFKDISEGSPDDGMPAFKGKLTDDQIKAVVKHLRKLQGA